MHTILQQLGEIGIVPVIKIDNAEHAVPLARALREGGIPCAEVTFRTAAGEEAMRTIAREFPDMLLGAGTMLSIEQADRAVDAGARFIVSPGFNPAVVEHCVKKGIPIAPGCSSPTDMERAMEFGLDVVKVFPAEQLGGLPFLEAVSAPYPALHFMPTGGIGPDNLCAYLGFEKVLACGGSWMVPSVLIAGGRFEEITRLCREAVRLMLGVSLAHIGINTENEEKARETAEAFAALLGFCVKPGSGSFFAGEYVEAMKTPYLGWNGHIGFGVNNVVRARAYFERQGYAFRQDTAKYTDSGKLNSIYFENELADFAVHIVNK